MAHCLSALLLAATAGMAAQAQTGDPLASSDCQAAREILEAALNDTGGSPQERAHRLAQARRHAARACLGPSTSQPERSGAPEPAQRVAPPVISVAPAPARPAAAPPPPLAIPRAASITTCDLAGCWDSDGRRLNQIGPLLMGPRGPCNRHGGVVNCP